MIVVHHVIFDLFLIFQPLIFGISNLDMLFQAFQNWLRNEISFLLGLEGLSDSPVSWLENKLQLILFSACGKRVASCKGQSETCPVSISCSCCVNSSNRNHRNCELFFIGIDSAAFSILCDYDNCNHSFELTEAFPCNLRNPPDFMPFWKSISVWSRMSSSFSFEYVLGLDPDQKIQSWLFARYYIIYWISVAKWTN